MTGSALYYMDADDPNGRLIEPGHWVEFDLGTDTRYITLEGCVDSIDYLNADVRITEYEDESGETWTVPYEAIRFLGVDGDDAEARANGVRTINGLILACDDIDALHEYAIDQAHNRGAEGLMVARILHAVRQATETKR